MTANGLSLTVHGNLVIAPSPSRRWQIMNFSTQQRSQLESLGTISVWMTLTLWASRVPVIQFNPDHAGNAGRPWEVYGQLHASPYTLGKQTHKLHCCSSCWTLGSHSCKYASGKMWNDRKMHKILRKVLKPEEKHFRRQWPVEKMCRCRELNECLKNLKIYFWD